MPLQLVLSVRLHDSRYHGASEWPPAPARLFQALIAGAGLGGPLEEAERAALKWLERLDPPVIGAPKKWDCSGFVLYVPNNDLDRVGGDPRLIGKVRTARKEIKPKLFDSRIPFAYAWTIDENQQGRRHAYVTCALAERLYQFGRGVDFAWAWGEMIDDQSVADFLSRYPGRVYRPSGRRNGGGGTLKCPEEGSLESLELRYATSRQRFSVGNGDDGVVRFVQPPKPRFRLIGYDSPPSRLMFDLRETSATASFALWPQQQTVALTTRLRDAACARLRAATPNRAAMIERALIGREANEADKALRLRILPLPSIGHEHAERSIRRVLVEVPPACPIPANDIAWAFSGLPVEEETIDKDTGEIVGETRLVHATEREMLAHYGIETDAAYRVWRTVTPAALPECAARRRIEPIRRREEAKDAGERLVEEDRAVAATRQALRHAGISTPVTSVRVQREPFSAKGARAEAFSADTRFAKERLWHVEIGFAEPIKGPLVVGDGRYMGLGLMAPLRCAEGIHCFKILHGLSDRADAIVLAHALRRAMMYRVQERIGRQATLPAFFSGHEPNGPPSRSGIHAHLAFAADLVRQRLLIVSPHVLEARQPTSHERQHLETLDACVADLSDLRAGAAGRLRLAWSRLQAHEDPLFGAARTWESVTDYQPTRHGKRMTPNEALVSDVQSEVLRRGMAIPTHIEVIELREGPRGGLAGRLRLHFATVVSGPILIGRTRHFGGGLFSALN